MVPPHRFPRALPRAMVKRPLWGQVDIQLTQVDATRSVWARSACGYGYAWSEPKGERRSGTDGAEARSADLRPLPEPGRCGEPRVQAGSLHPRDSSRRKPTPRRRTSTVRPRAVGLVLWCNGARCTYPASARACRSAPAQWAWFSGATGPVAPTRPLPAHAGPPPRSGLGSLVQRGPLHLPGLCPRMPVRPRAVGLVLWRNGARCTYPAPARAQCVGDGQYCRRRSG